MNAAVESVDLAPGRETFLRDVLAGLALPQKSIPAKYFYDTRGSLLFERITGLPEYYPTRTELGILERRADEIARLIGRDAVLVEFGAGATRKVRILLDALPNLTAFIPVDISGEHLLEAAQALAADYPETEILPVVADYTAPFTLPLDGARAWAKRVVFFPGSTIGNFTAAGARRFLSRTAAFLRTGGEMIVGVDLKKDRAILESAYDDAQGVTAAFNLNLLHRINDELGGTFDPGLFSHRAVWNEAAGRIEMHLVSRVAQTVRVAGRHFAFAPGETIHTENSHKFTVAEFQALAGDCGMKPVAVWTDPQRLFSVHYLRAA